MTNEDDIRLELDRILRVFAPPGVVEIYKQNPLLNLLIKNAERKRMGLPPIGPVLRFSKKGNLKLTLIQGGKT